MTFTNLLHTSTRFGLLLLLLLLTISLSLSRLIFTSAKIEIYFAFATIISDWMTSTFIWFVNRVHTRKLRCLSSSQWNEIIHERRLTVAPKFGHLFIFMLFVRCEFIRDPSREFLTDAAIEFILYLKVMNACTPFVWASFLFLFDKIWMRTCI